MFDNTSFHIHPPDQTLFYERLMERCEGTAASTIKVLVSVRGKHTVLAAIR